MKRAAKFREAVVRAVHKKTGEMLREQIPLRDMSDCLLAQYDEVSRRAFQRCIVRGAREGNDREDWKAAEDDLFGRISVEFEESGGNLYALASVPGCAGTEIMAAVDECWLLIAGYVGPSAREDADEDFGDYMIEDFGKDTRSSERSNGGRLSAHASPATYATTMVRVRVRGRKATSVMRIAASPVCARRGHSAWWRCERRWIRGGARRCFSNGLLAIRMGKAGLETPVPCVA